MSNEVEVEPAEETVITDHIIQRQSRPSRIDASEDASRATDLAVYRTYFDSIGIKNLSVFIVFGLAFAFCIKFPGE